MKTNLNVAFALLAIALAFPACGLLEPGPGDVEFQQGMALYEAGRYPAAHEMFEASLEERRAAHGLVNSETLMALMYAAASLYMDARDHEAKEFIAPFLEQIEAHKGRDTLEYAKVSADYATALRGLGEFDEAVERLRHSVSIHVAVLGAEHRDTLTAMHKLNLALSSGGYAEEAVEAERRLLQLRTKVLGEDHPNTVRTLANLSFALSKVGEYEEAALLDGRSLDLRKRVFGENHPELYIGMVNYAVSLGRLERFEEALEICEPAYAYFYEMNGPEHPDTIWAVRELVYLYRSEGNHRKAEALTEMHGLRVPNETDD